MKSSPEWINLTDTVLLRATSWERLKLSDRKVRTVKSWSLLKSLQQTHTCFLFLKELFSALYSFIDYGLSVVWTSRLYRCHLKSYRYPSVSYHTDAVVLDVFEDQRGDQSSAPLDRGVIWKLSAWTKKHKSIIRRFHTLLLQRKRKTETCRQLHLYSFMCTLHFCFCYKVKSNCAMKWKIKLHMHLWDVKWHCKK